MKKVDDVVRLRTIAEIKKHISELDLKALKELKDEIKHLTQLIYENQQNFGHSKLIIPQHSSLVEGEPGIEVLSPSFFPEEEG